MVKFYRSSVINAPADRVWRVVRDFNALPEWHPAIAESRIEQHHPSDKVGCIRNFSLKDGGRIREQLLALSDFEFTCVYSILESPMGVDDYIATLKVTPITDGNRCFIEWSAEFECAPGRERELSELVGNSVFQGGFNALKERLGGR
jgi:hypothetical protein